MNIGWKNVLRDGPYEVFADHRYTQECHSRFLMRHSASAFLTATAGVEEPPRSRRSR
jgi:hypothetical protein